MKDDEEENLLDQEHIQQLGRKRLAAMKDVACPICASPAILVMTVEEDEPQRDEDGFLQYHCPVCAMLFRVDEARKRV